MQLQENSEQFEHQNAHPGIVMKQMKPSSLAAVDPALDPGVVTAGASGEEEEVPHKVDVVEHSKRNLEELDEVAGFKEKTNAVSETGAGQREDATDGGQEAFVSLKKPLIINEKATFGLISSNLLPSVAHTKSSNPTNRSTYTTTDTMVGSIDVLNPWFLSGGTPNFRPGGSSSQVGNEDGETLMGLRSNTAGSGGGYQQTMQPNANTTSSDDCTVYSTVQNAIKSEKDASHRFDSKLLQALLHNS